MHKPMPLAEKLTATMSFTGEEPSLVKPPAKTGDDVVRVITGKFDEDRKVGGEDKTFKVARFAMVHADREAVVFTTHRRASWFPSEKAALQVRDRIQPKVPESVLEVVSYTPPVKHRLRHVQGGGQ